MSKQVVAEVIALIELGMIAPEDIVKCLRKANSKPEPAPVLDYAWPAVADYENDMGFEVNQTFRMAWDMARTTNNMFGKTTGENT
jgi:hypothetical protein